MDLTLSILLRLAGVFTLVLGILHVFLPALLDYKSALLERPAGWKTPRPFRVWPTRYRTKPSDLLGVVWVMNHAASYALVSIGVVDLVASDWLRGEAGRWLALWIGGWWLLRAATQLTFGRRTGDWLILVWFAALGTLHLVVALPGW